MEEDESDGDGWRHVPGIGFLTGGVAACIAVTFTNPWEVVKTRLQLQGELAQRRLAPGAKPVPLVYEGVVHAFGKIARVEGLWGLQRGLVPAYLYQLTMNGIRFGGYDTIKASLLSLMPAGDFRRRESVQLVTGMVSGATAGTIGAALGSPFFLVKTRMQSYSTQIAVGTQHLYGGTVDALRTIYRSDGIRGVYIGAPAAMLRTGVGSSIQLATFDRTKQAVLRSGIVSQDSIGADFLASMLSGFMVCVGMNPFDVVSTRIYNQAVDPRTGRGLTYRNPFDCFAKTTRSEGVRGLYKGFFAHYLRIGPHTVLCFIFLEQLRRLARANNIHA